MSEENKTNKNEEQSKRPSQTDNTIIKLKEDDLNNIASIDLSIQNTLNALGALLARFDKQRKSDEQKLDSLRENYKKGIKKLGKKYKIKGNYTIDYSRKALVRVPNMPIKR